MVNDIINDRYVFIFFDDQWDVHADGLVCDYLFIRCLFIYLCIDYFCDIQCFWDPNCRVYSLHPIISSSAHFHQFVLHIFCEIFIDLSSFHSVCNRDNNSYCAFQCID